MRYPTVPNHPGYRVSHRGIVHAFFQGTDLDAAMRYAEKLAESTVIGEVITLTGSFTQFTFYGKVR